MRAQLAVLLALAALLASCAEAAPPLPAVDSLTSMDDAARAAELSLAVPADLTLAVAYTESRWEVPAQEETSGEGHAPALVGVGGLRPWLPGDRIGAAARTLGVDAQRVALDPIAGTLATAVVLRDLAVARYGSVPAPSSPQWAEVLGDYSGLTGDAARLGYAADVLRTLADGIRDVAASGETITVAPRTIAMPELAASREALGAADYGPAHWVAASSSNYTAGRGGHAINCIVIHDMEGSYASAISWFQNPSAMAAAHYCIRSSDGDITQMVHEGDTAWHAGNWDYNQRCIGIEHEGYASAPSRWYTEAMYQASADLVRHLCAKYGIPIDRAHIIGHAEVPDPYHAGEFGGAGHHTDPGSGWNWSHYMDLVRGTPPVPAWDASYVGKSFPTDMTSGDRVVAYLDMRNDGSSAWTLGGTFVGTWMPMDHASPLFDSVNWVNDHRATPPDHSGYGTGVTGRFTFMVHAPDVTADTTISEHFRLVQEGVTWFGPDVPVTVHVHPRAVTPPAVDAGTPPSTTDADHDGVALPADCDDTRADVHPGATEVCGDGVDQDCDGHDVACPAYVPDGAVAPHGDGGVEIPRGDAGGPSGHRPYVASGGCSVGGGGATGRGAWALTLGLAALVARRRTRRAS